MLLILLEVSTACGTSSGAGQTANLKGGTEIILQAACNLNYNHCSDNQLALLSTTIAILQKRIQDGLNTSQAIVRQRGSDQIVVDLPPLTNEQKAAALLEQTGKLEFIDTGPTSLELGTIVQAGQYPVVFTGDQLDPSSIKATTDTQGGHPVILFAFKPATKADFATYTRQNIGNYLTMTMDAKVIESAVIQSEITDQGQISGGGMTLDAAQQTATLMRSGSLPLPLSIISQKSIGG